MFTFDNCDIFKVYIGLNDGESHIQEIDTESAMAMVSFYVASHFDGATVYSGIGVYRHENGDIVRENSLIIELLDVTPVMVESLVQHCKKVLNQESILVTHSVIEYQFYG